MLAARVGPAIWEDAFPGREASRVRRARAAP
jgi:hypothetical protein